MLEKYLAKHGHASSGLLGINKRIRYTEGILEEGELLAVVGKGTWQKKDQLKFKIPAEKFLLISADNEEPVYFSDDPEITDAAE